MPLPGGVSLSVAEILAQTRTDAWAVLHGDRLVTEEYFGAMGAETRHLLMSVSKSLVSCVVGSLAGSGAIDLARGIEHYIPELRGTGYAGATVRNLLDMRSGVRFSEEYLDPASEVGNSTSRSAGRRRFREAPQRSRNSCGAWNASGNTAGISPTAAARPTCSAGSARKPAASRSRSWPRSCCGQGSAPAATPTSSRMPQGTGMFDGGICATLGDLVRFGAMIRDGGVSLTGQRVLDRAWVDDIFAGGADSREAFAAGDHEEDMPGGMYRSQFWFPSGDRDAAFCLGIHGQMIYINRASGVVGVKLSSTALPVDPFEGPAAAAMFGAINEHLLAASPTTGD